MISLNDVLLAMSNIPVDDPIAEIWGRGLQGGDKIIEYTNALPITINAKGDALLDYRIYGADGGVGVATESGEPAGYKLPMTVQSGNLFDKNTTIDGYEINESGIVSNRLWCVSDFIPVVSGGHYIGYFNTGNAILEYRSKTENGVFHTGLRNGLVMYDTTNFIKINCPIASKNIASIVQLKATPPVYIGENQLGEDEYVSYGEQKIYRNVDGTLTPTDPPVPFPDIPTIKGETVIDYDGDPKPSQMYIKYKGKG